VELSSPFSVFVAIYLGITTPFVVWGVVVFSQWSRMDPAKPSLAAQDYIPWMYRANDEATVPTAPAPLDIARAILLTLTPVVNFAAFGPAGLLLLTQLADKALSWAYGQMDTAFDALTARVAKKPIVQRLNTWARRPMNQPSSHIE